MAAIRFPCPSCEKPIKAPPGQAGERFQCPRCGAAVTAPGESGGDVPAPPSPSLDDDFDSLFWDAKGPTAQPPAAPPISPAAPPPQPNKATPPTSAQPPAALPTKDRGPAPPNPPPPKHADIALPPPTGDTQKDGRLPPPSKTLPAAPGRVVNRPPTKQQDQLAAEQAKKAAATKKRKKRKAPRFRISCNVCGTRIEVSLRQVGAQVKCPDCHSQVTVEAPPEFRKQASDQAKAKQRQSADDDIIGLGPAPEVTISNVADEVLDEIRRSVESAAEQVADVKGDDLPAEREVPADSPTAASSAPPKIDLMLGTRSLLDDSPEDSSDRDSTDEGRVDATSSSSSATGAEPSDSEAASIDLEAPLEEDEWSESSRPYGFDCGVCGTRVHATLEGEQIKCPDCFTALTAPPPPKQYVDLGLNKPANDDDDEFRLSAAHERPKYEPLAARGGVTLDQINRAERKQDPGGSDEGAKNRPARAATFPYRCPQCGNSIVVTERHLGAEFNCPQCKTVSTIERGQPAPQRSPSSAAPAPTATPVASPPQAPPPVEDSTANRSDIDDAGGSLPSLAPAVAAPPVSPMFSGNANAKLKADPVAQETAREAMQSAESEEPEVKQPDLLDLPYLPSVFGFLFQADAVLQVVGYSLIIGAELFALMVAGYLFAQGGGAAIFGFLVGVLGAVIALPFGVISGALMQAIVGDTANGSKQVQSWPELANMQEHLPLFFMMVSAVLCGLAPGGALGSLLHNFGLPSYFAVVLVIPSIFLFYPFALLSLLENDSLFIPVSRHILMGTIRLPLAWVQFYVESVAICLLTVACLSGLSISFYAIPFVAIGLALLYFIYHRVLGRLSYRLAMADAETDAAEQLPD